MAKALIGHLPASDPHQAQELRRLRRRVGDLEAMVGRLSAENDALVAAYLALRPAEDAAPPMLPDPVRVSSHAETLRRSEEPAGV